MKVSRRRHAPKTWPWARCSHCPRGKNVGGIPAHPNGWFPFREGTSHPKEMVRNGKRAAQQELGLTHPCMDPCIQTPLRSALCRSPRGPTAPAPLPAALPLGNPSAFTFCLLPFTRGAACGATGAGSPSRARPGLSLSLRGAAAEGGGVRSPALRAAPAGKPERRVWGLISSYCLPIVRGGNKSLTDFCGIATWLPRGEERSDAEPRGTRRGSLTPGTACPLCQPVQKTPRHLPFSMYHSA